MMRPKKLSVLVGIIGLAVLATAAVPWRAARTPTPRAQSAPEDSIKASIRGLCSLDRPAHAYAKAALLRSASAAATDLLSSLGYLVTNDGLRYDKGKQLMGSPPCPIPTPIIVGDICEIRAEAGCKEAVPLMAEAMSLGDSSDSWEDWNGPMEGLVKIGPCCAPYVVKAVRNSASTALSRAAAEYPKDPDPQKRLAIDYDFRIKARGAMVLGRIGGREALDALEQLRKEKQPSYLYPYLDDAIKQVGLRR
jgi:hypothetical protein